MRLLDVERQTGALLLERLDPGTPLAELADDEEATRIAARVMRQLWRPVPPEHPFPSVSRWAEGLGRLRQHYHGGTGPLPSALVEKAERLFAELLETMDECVLLHGDLHHWNVLSARRCPWLAIDPKGVVGEPAYEAGALLRNVAPHLLTQPPEAHSAERRSLRIIRRRVEILAEELGCSRERILGWGLAQAVLSAWWSVEDHGRGWEWGMHWAGVLDQAMR